MTVHKDFKMKTFPTLYHKSKTGALVQWDIWTEGDTIITRHGQIGGKLQLSPKKATPKNFGKANATTAEEQAILEAQAMWTFKRERKYSETKEGAKEEIFLPMLAHDFHKKKGRGIVYPCDLQPKLDGVRAMAYWEDGRVVLGTRGGKEWTAPKHIIEELEKVMPQEMVLDGELYVHGVDFESLTSWAKKYHEGETEQLEYHVFDMPINELGKRDIWKNRLKNLEAFFHKLNPTSPKYESAYLVLVPTYIVNQVVKLPKYYAGVCSACLQPTYEYDEIFDFEKTFVEQGYEGCIVRNWDGEYLFGHRSSDIQKVKSFQDAEYKVVDFEHGVGKMANSAIWICETKDHKRFKATPKASAAKREEYYRDGKKYIGKLVKVAFQNLTADGIPRFPRALGFRDKKDM
jgi:ATP-dependent DNA ligase